MKQGMRFYMVLVWTLLVLGGCATTNTAVNAPPPTGTVSTPEFDASISPLMKDTKSCCIGFDFQFANKTDKKLEIVWDKTLYLSGNETKGTFMFEPGTCKIGEGASDNSPNTEVVLPRGTVSREVWPGSLSNFSGPTLGCFHMPMGSGERGMDLAVRVDDHIVQKRLVLTVPKEETP